MPFRSASTFNRIVPSFTSGARAVSISWRNGTNALLNVEADRRSGRSGKISTTNSESSLRSTSHPSNGNRLATSSGSCTPPRRATILPSRSWSSLIVGIPSLREPHRVGSVEPRHPQPCPAHDIQRDGADMTTLDVIDARQSQGAKHAPQCLPTCVHAQCIVE